MEKSHYMAKHSDLFVTLDHENMLVLTVYITKHPIFLVNFYIKDYPLAKIFSCKIFIQFKQCMKKLWSVYLRSPK